MMERQPMLEEKRGKPLSASCGGRRQQPQSLRVDEFRWSRVNGKVDIDYLVMVIAGSVAGGP